MSCPSSTLCVAVDGQGHALEYDNGTWSQPLQIDGGTILESVSCTTVDFCGAVDDNSHVIVGVIGPPVVSSITPSSGSVSGGTSVAITGANFINVTNVFFGSTPASSFVVNSPSSITAVAPKGSGSVDVTVSTYWGTSSNNSGDVFTYTNIGTYFPIALVRIVDTRQGATDPSTYAGSTLKAGQTLSVPVVNANGDNVPPNAQAVVVNLTAVNPSSWGYLTVYPTGNTLPNLSSANFQAGVSAVANLVEVPLGTNGEINIYNAFGTTDVLVDVEGYVASSNSSAGLYNPISPSRILDTRTYLGNNYQFAGKELSQGQMINLNVLNLGGLPASGVLAVALNVTEVNATSNGGYFSLFPSGQSLPSVSNLNFYPQLTIANRVIVKIGSNNQISLYNALGNANAIIDVVGYYTGNTLFTGYDFHAVNPNRVVDTRPNSTYQRHNQTFGPGTSNSFVIGGYQNDGVPANAKAVILNVIATNTTSNGGYLTVYPQGTSLPSSSDLNWYQGQSIPNMVPVKLSSTGEITISVFNSSADVTVDVFGWYG